MNKPKTNGASPAFPLNDGAIVDVSLTKREYYAGLAMQGILAYVGSNPDRVVALRAVEAADLLIAQLNK